MKTERKKEITSKENKKKTDQIRDRFLTPHLFSSAGSCHRHLQSNHPVLHREAQPPTPPSAASPIVAGVPVFNPTPPGPHRRKLPLPHLCSAAPLCCEEEEMKKKIEEEISKGTGQERRPATPQGKKRKKRKRK
jgi:hypothetical protein